MPDASQVAALTQRYADTSHIRDLAAHELKVFSQNGEDGVIAEIIRRIETETSHQVTPAFVEFGAERGSEGNCIFLADVLGWEGLLIELGDESFQALATKYFRSPRIRTFQAAVTADNLESLIAQSGVDIDGGVLSIDTDGNDYWIWEGAKELRPALVIVEYNASLGPDVPLAIMRDDAFAEFGTCYYGAGFAAWQHLAAVKGYKLVHADTTGVNLFYVREDIHAGVESFQGLKPGWRPPNYLYLGIPGYAADPANRPWVDVTSGELVFYTPGGDVVAVKDADPAAPALQAPAAPAPAPAVPEGLVAVPLDSPGPEGFRVQAGEPAPEPIPEPAPAPEPAPLIEVLPAEPGQGPEAGLVSVPLGSSEPLRVGGSAPEPAAADEYAQLHVRSLTGEELTVVIPSFDPDAEVLIPAHEVPQPILDGIRVGQSSIKAIVKVSEDGAGIESISGYGPAI